MNVESMIEDILSGRDVHSVLSEGVRSNDFLAKIRDAVRQGIKDNFGFDLGNGKLDGGGRIIFTPPTLKDKYPIDSENIEEIRNLIKSIVSSFKGVEYGDNSRVFDSIIDINLKQYKKSTIVSDEEYLERVKKGAKLYLQKFYPTLADTLLKVENTFHIGKKYIGGFTLLLDVSAEDLVSLGIKRKHKVIGDKARGVGYVPRDYKRFSEYLMKYLLPQNKDDNKYNLIYDIKNVVFYPTK